MLADLPGASLEGTAHLRGALHLMES